MFLHADSEHSKLGWSKLSMGSRQFVDFVMLRLKSILAYSATDVQVVA